MKSTATGIAMLAAAALALAGCGQVPRDSTPVSNPIIPALAKI